jgi:hypothetical protein
LLYAGISIVDVVAVVVMLILVTVFHVKVCNAHSGMLGCSVFATKAKVKLLW